MTFELIIDGAMLPLRVLCISFCLAAEDRHTTLSSSHLILPNLQENKIVRSEEHCKVDISLFSSSIITLFLLILCAWGAVVVASNSKLGMLKAEYVYADSSTLLVGIKLKGRIIINIKIIFNGRNPILYHL